MVHYGDYRVSELKTYLHDRGHQDAHELVAGRSMKAIVVEDNALRWRTLPDPVAGVGEVLIRNRATAINRADLAQRAGGLSAAARRESDPRARVRRRSALRWARACRRTGVGDRVCALLAGGGYAELVNVPAGQALRIPQRT